MISLENVATSSSSSSPSSSSSSSSSPSSSTSSSTSSSPSSSPSSSLSSTFVSSSSINAEVYNDCTSDPVEGESLVQDNTRCSTQEVDPIHSLSEGLNQLLKLSSQELNQLTDHQKYIDNDDNNIITNMNMMNADDNNTSTNTNMMNIDGNNISTNTNMMDINNDNISTNEPITMTTFTLHPNVIQAMSDQWPDSVHFELSETNNINIDIRHFYYGGNQIDYDSQY